MLLGLYAIASPVARGAAVALAALTKFVPLVLLPLFAGHGGRRRAATLTLVGFAGVCAIAMTPVLVDTRPGTF